MKTYKKSLQDGPIDLVECGESAYRLYCTNKDRYFKHLTALVNECLWAVKDQAKKENRKWSYVEVFEACDEHVLVVVFTDDNGQDWIDEEAKIGRIWLSYDYIHTIIKYCIDARLPRYDVGVVP